MQGHVQITHEMDQELEGFDPLPSGDATISDHAGELFDLLHNAIVILAVPRTIVADAIGRHFDDVPRIGLRPVTISDLVGPTGNSRHFVLARTEKSSNVGSCLARQVVSRDLRDRGMTRFPPCEASSRHEKGQE